jgi:hypothetical protein
MEHLKSTPYSKQENGLVERANKEVNRYLRNIVFDRKIIKEWSEYLPLIMRHFNTAIKTPLGVSPNAIIFGNSIDTNRSLLQDMNVSTDKKPLTSFRQYVDQLITRQFNLIKVAAAHQAEYNEDQLAVRYSKYHPKIKHRFILPDDKLHASQSGHSTTASFSSGTNQHRDVSVGPHDLDVRSSDHSSLTKVTPSEPSMVHTSRTTPTHSVGSPASKIKKTQESALPKQSYNRYAPASAQQEPEHFRKGELNQSSKRYPSRMMVAPHRDGIITRSKGGGAPIDQRVTDALPKGQSGSLCSDTKSIVLSAMTATPQSTSAPLAYEVTRYKVGDLVLKLYPSSMAGTGAPNKLGSFWQGPLRVIQAFLDEQRGDAYTIENLVTGRITRTHVSQLKPFYYDPSYIIPLNVAVKDTEEFIVEDIMEHKSDGHGSYLWRVRWDGYDEDDDTWEPLPNIKDVEKFHSYCRRYSSLQKFIPKRFKK